MVILFLYGNSSHSLESYSGYFVSDSGDTPRDGAVKVTSFGNTTLLFDDGETRILFDCFFTRPSLLRSIACKIKTDRRLMDRLLSENSFSGLRGIFISHSYYDHLLDGAYMSKKTGAVLYGSESTLNVGRGGNVPEENLTAFKVNTPVKIGNFTVTVLKSKHSEPGFYNNDIGVEIKKPLKQPARRRDYTEGGSFDFLIEYGGRKILIRPGFNYIEGSLENIRAEVLFAGIALSGRAGTRTRDKFYAETIGKVRPHLVVPVHWDNFFLPLDSPPRLLFRFADNLPASLNYFIKRTGEDGISFKMLRAYQSIILFQGLPPE